MVPSKIGMNMQFPHKNHSPPQPSPEHDSIYENFDMLAGSSSVSDSTIPDTLNGNLSSHGSHNRGERDLDFDFDEIDDVAKHLTLSPPTEQNQEVFAEQRTCPSVPLPKTPRTPATTNDAWTSQADISPSRDAGATSPRHRQSPRKLLGLHFGAPRSQSSQASSDHQAAASTHSTISTLDQSHRQAAKYPASRLRLNPATKLTSPHRPQRLLAGIPSLPAFPDKSFLLDEKAVDKWGRPEASPTTSNIALLLCCLFPPFWLPLGSGFFDALVGVVPRRTKVISLILGTATLLAAVALSIVFCII